MRISIGVEGEEKLDRALRGVAADTSDLRPSWRPVSDEIYSIVRKQFASKRGWKPRAQSTIDRYTAMNRRGFSVINETLRRTDAMFKAVSTRGASHGIYIEESDSLTVGTDLPYAGIHQSGGSKIPQRKIYDLDDSDVTRLIRILRRGLTEKIADRGFDISEAADTGAIPF
jgi:phage gpG-like protein